jgi:hypothetical protein
MSLTARPEGESNPIVNFKDEVKELSMGELLQLAEAPEKMIDAPFEVEGLIGDLALQLTDDEEKNQQLRDAIKKKVDDSYRMIESLDAFAAHQEIRAQRYLDRARIAKNRSKAILNYFTYQMQQHGISELRGVDYKAFEKFSAVPELVKYREPEAQDHVLFPEYVNEIPASYTWKANPIKDALKPFYAAIENTPACADCKGRGKVIDNEYFTDCFACAGTGKLIPDEIHVPFAHSIGGLKWNSKIVFDDNYQAPPKKERKKKK